MSLFPAIAIRGFISILLVRWTAVVMAAGDAAQLMHANNDIGNQASLQRGARNYVNYCMGCHSLEYMRFNQLAQLRNAIRHSRSVDEVTRKDGEAALLWFEGVLADVLRERPSDGTPR